MSPPILIRIGTSFMFLTNIAIFPSQNPDYFVLTEIKPQSCNEMLQKHYFPDLIVISLIMYVYCFWYHLIFIIILLFVFIMVLYYLLNTIYEEKKYSFKYYFTILDIAYTEYSSAWFPIGQLQSRFCCRVLWLVTNKRLSFG